MEIIFQKKNKESKKINFSLKKKKKIIFEVLIKFLDFLKDNKNNLKFPENLKIILESRFDSFDDLINKKNSKINYLKEIKKNLNEIRIYNKKKNALISSIKKKRFFLKNK